jgi:hypothetical protein
MNVNLPSPNLLLKNRFFLPVGLTVTGFLILSPYHTWIGIGLLLGGLGLLYFNVRDWEKKHVESKPKKRQTLKPRKPRQSKPKTESTGSNNFNENPN